MQVLSKKYLKEHFTEKNPIEFPNLVRDVVPTPLLSVILITYNHISYIEKSILGILSQRTTFPFEIIIGDDDSSDGTREICKQFARQHPDKIRLVQHHRANNIKIMGKPCGIYQIAYNLLAARGKYLAICSGDDYWTDPMKLQKQVDFLEKNPEYSLCFHPWREVYGHEISTTLGDVRSTEADTKWAKPSTWTFININDQIPTRFLSVMQEDVFLSFILESIGKRSNLLEIKPGIINTPSNSIMRSIKDERELLLQKLNRSIQMYKAFAGQKHNRKKLNKILLNSLKLVVKNPSHIPFALKRLLA